MGVAERFVRTLKEWLAWHTWQNDTELAALLAEFSVYYNARIRAPNLPGFHPMSLPNTSTVQPVSVHYRN